MTRLTLYRIAIKGISQHNIPFIAKLPHANRGAMDKKGDFRVLFHALSVTNFCTKKHDIPTFLLSPLSPHHRCGERTRPACWCKRQADREAEELFTVPLMPLSCQVQQCCAKKEQMVRKRAKTMVF